MTASQPNSNTNSDFEIRDFFLAPWGLSSEELPMHILWSGEFERLEIHTPKNI